MTNKDALERVIELSKAQEIPFDRYKQNEADCMKLRQALEVNQELVKALKEAVRLWDEHKATHEYHITSWKQALAKAEGGKNE